MPVFQASTTRVLTSYERDGNLNPGVDRGNKDFNSFLAVCGDRPALFGQQLDGQVSCGPGELGYLIAAADGPGFVSRMSITVGVFEPGTGSDAPPRFVTAPRRERIRIHVDGVVAYEGALADWSQGGDPPFEAPLAGWTSGTTLSYVPISYARSPRIFLDDLSTGLSAYYPHVTMHSSAATQGFDSAALSSPAARAQLAELALRASSPAADRWFDSTLTLDSAEIRPVWSRDRAGTVQRIRIELATDAAAETLSEIVLRCYWDSHLTPAINLPLATLFGAYQTLSSFDTWPMSVIITPSTTTLSLSLPMPFARGVRVELARPRPGPARELHVRIDGVDATPSAEYGRLHADWALRDHPGAGERFALAELTGRGRYVGALMYMKGNASLVSPSADPLNFLEGDELLEVDGSANPGIGTEDYFGGGWYFQGGPFSSPFAALLHKSSDAELGQGEVTALRWNAASDAIDFEHAFRLSFEYGPNMPATAREYAAVSFYYQ